MNRENCPIQRLQTAPDHTEQPKHIPTLEDLSDFHYLLRGTFRTCQHETLKGREYTTEEVYEHVYVTNGGCHRCEVNFNGLKEPLEKMYADFKSDPVLSQKPITRLGD